MNLKDIRKEYAKFELKLEDLSNNPIDQFNQWLEDAEKHGNLESTAMTLSTIDLNGEPDSRIVLLKGVSKENGFRFFTNYNSNKGKSLAKNPVASLLFFWPKSERQVRIKGSIKKCKEAESIAYFNSRPIGSQAGAVASEQSSVVDSKDAMIETYEQLITKEQIDKPTHWGGYDVIPTQIEFWQGGKNRLHDRFRFTLMENNEWKIERLAP